jgi:hypothetical protein
MRHDSYTLVPLEIREAAQLFGVEEMMKQLCKSMSLIVTYEKMHSVTEATEKIEEAKMLATHLLRVRIEEILNVLLQKEGEIKNFEKVLDECKLEIEELKKKLDTMTSLNMCKICLVAPAVFAIFPCGHMCCCETCCKTEYENCPICRQDVLHIQKIYL